jgi:thiol-disulfide isomerase/thioredoxin
MKFNWVLCAYLLSVVNVSASDSLTGLNMSHMDAGKPAPAFILPTLEGKLIDSHSLSGQVIILNFWATWCGPCKEEMPSLEKLRQRLDSERFRLFAVTTDIRPQDIANFWDYLDLHFEVLLDEQEALSQALMVRNLPTTVIIDTKGRLVGRMMGPRDWNSPGVIALLNNLLNRP